MVSCKQCGKKITNPNDVNVLAMLGVVPKTFCNGCYSAKERGLMRHIAYWPRQPINGTLFKIRFAFLTLIWIVVLAFAVFRREASYFFIAAFFSLLVLWYFALWRSARNTVREVEKSAAKQ